MAFRTACVGSSGYRLPVSAFSVLTYQHLRILSINCQKVFATVGAFLVCHIVMAERSLSALDLIYDLTGILTDPCEEFILTEFPVCDIAEFHLPVCGKFRLLQFFRNQFQELFCLGGNVDLIASFFHHKTVKKFLDDIGSCCYCSKTAGFAQSFCRLFVVALHKVDRILHGAKKCGLCKSCRRFCLSICKGCRFHSKNLAFRKGRKLLVFQPVSLLFFLILTATFIDFSPSGAFYDSSACGESFSCCRSFHAHLLIYSRRIQHT